MIVNATYADLHVGTGVYTRNVLAALPEARRLRLPATLLRPGGARFWTRRAAETALAARRGTVVHPYWAPDASPRHVVAVLDFVQHREATRAEQRLLDRAGRRASAVLVLSEHVAAQVAWSRPQVVVAPPFPDDAWFDTPVVARARGRAGPARLGYFGGWHARKGMTSFLTVLSASSLAGDVEVHCTGNPPPVPGVRVVPHGDLTTAQTVALADDCDVVAYPSTEEGYGLPVVEALLRERPVVCRDLEVYREFVRQPVALHHAADWDDPESVATAVSAALAAPAFTRGEALRTADRREATARLRTALLTAIEVVA